MAVDMFLKHDGIKGESRDAKFRDQIEILSFSWGVHNNSQVCGSGGGEGRATFDAFTIVKKVDSASPKLFQACATGQHIKEATISVRKAGEKPVEYLKIKLEDILISSAQTAGGGATEPAEQVALNFRKFEIDNGTDVPASFDVCFAKETLG